MSSSIRDNTKRRGRPKTTGSGLMVGVRLLPPVLDPLDAWIADQPDPKPSRPEAIRTAVTEQLKAKGYLVEHANSTQMDDFKPEVASRRLPKKEA